MNEPTPTSRRNVWVLGLVSFFQDMSSELIYPLLPLFLVQVLGADTRIVGLIEGAAESTASLLKLVSGWLSDRWGSRKGWAVAGYGLSGLIKPVLALTVTWPQVLVIRLLDRTGKGLRTSPRDALLAASVESDERGWAFGFHRSMDTLGAVAGPLAAFLLLGWYGGKFRPVFAWALVPGIISVGLLAGLAREVSYPATSSEAADHPTDHASLSREFKLFVAVVGLFALGNSSDAFLILRAQSVGLAAAVVPLAWMATNVVYALAATPAGKAADQLGKKRVMVGGYLFFALIYAGFAAATQSWQIWPLFAGYGLYHGLTDGVGRALVADLVGESTRGTAYGLYHAVTGLSLFPASVIGGFLWFRFGPSALFLFGAGLACVAALLLFSLPSTAVTPDTS
jgi:MFS family permease